LKGRGFQPRRNRDLEIWALQFAEKLVSYQGIALAIPQVV